MINVLFSTDGDGHWWRREWPLQCDQKVFLSGECQGVKGHDGVHWCYHPSGSFEWDKNEDNLHDDDVVAGSTPPDHKDYVSPIDMQDKYWLSHFVDSEVIDKDEIARLERGEMKDGESITGPASRKVG